MAVNSIEFEGFKCLNANRLDDLFLWGFQDGCEGRCWGEFPAFSIAVMGTHPCSGDSPTVFFPRLCWSRCPWRDFAGFFGVFAAGWYPTLPTLRQARIRAFWGVLRVFCGCFLIYRERPTHSNRPPSLPPYPYAIPAPFRRCRFGPVWRRFPGQFRCAWRGVLIQTRWRRGAVRSPRAMAGG